MAHQQGHLAGAGAREGLAERDQFRVLPFVQPTQTLDEFPAEQAQVSGRPPEGGRPQTQEQPEFPEVSLQGVHWVDDNNE